MKIRIGTLGVALVLLIMAIRVSAQSAAPALLVDVDWLSQHLNERGLVVLHVEDKPEFDTGHVPGPNFHFEGPDAPQVEIFLSLYFALTGLHALHMVIGFGIMSVILWMAIKKKFSHEWYTPVELAGLYWHFVDIVWIFLFPLLYLVDRSHHFA